MGKHTPGPWKISGNLIEREDGAVICDCCLMPGKGYDEAVKELQANVNLIVAAPELLENLKKCLEVIDDNFDAITPCRTRAVPNPVMPPWVDDVIEAKELVNEIEGDLE